MDAIAPKPPTVAVASLGCKLNQAEAESLARQFVLAGYTVVAPARMLTSTCALHESKSTNLARA